MFKLLTKWAMDAHMQKNKNQEAIEAYDKVVSEIRNLLYFKMEEIKKVYYEQYPLRDPSYRKLLFYRNGYLVIETKNASKILFKKKRRTVKFRGFDLWYSKIPLDFLKQAKEIIKIQEG